MSKAAELAALIGSQTAQSNRNLIINGAMQVAQRGTSSTGVHTSGYYTCDRYEIVYSNEDELRQTITQASDGPDGFANSLKIQTTTAESAVASDERSYVIYRAEGQDLQQLLYGSSAAKKITLSFYVKSSVTGTYAVSVYQEDGNDVVGSTYTINSADTWEKKTITFPANTAASIADDNTAGLAFYWGIMLGSDYTSVDNSAWGEYAANRFFYGHAQNGVATTINATWQLTGVQLELGEQATPFEHRSFGKELALCERYFWKTYNYDVAPGTSSGASHLTGTPNATTSFFALQVPNVQMRDAPTRVIYNPNDGTVSEMRSDSSDHTAAITATSNHGGGAIYANNSSISANNFVKAHLTMDAEL